MPEHGLSDRCCRHRAEAAGLGEPGSLVPMSDRLSTLWIIVLYNMIFADILSFLNAEFLRGLMTGSAEGILITPLLLVGLAVLLEIPILMVFLSRVLSPAVNRRVAVPLTAVFVIGGGSTSHLFFAAVELVFLVLILRSVRHRVTS
jgi:hypothetical protein